MPSTSRFALVLLLCAASAQASPSLWERAATDAETAARAQRYEGAMHLGHELGQVAIAMDLGNLSDSVPASQRLGAVNRAIQAFRDAAAIDDTKPEPHYYIALLLLQTRINCRACSFDAKSASAAIAALDAFEARSPLDPRLTGLLSPRAILHTRLSGTVAGAKARAHLERALADYRTLLDRHSSTRADSELVYGNMAETLMMLGEVPEAIEQYRQALHVRPGTSNMLGLAVALDRDERGTEARTLIRDLGRTSIGEWELSVADGGTFYVPAGEVSYYRALIAEAFGNVELAIQQYDAFIRSGAHPQFAARALVNRNALRAKRS